MKRILIVLATLLVLFVALPKLAFELWLREQPSEIRVALQGFSTLEFLSAVRQEFFPQPIDDNAAYGRREYAARGHSPWVMRSSLDGRPRMLSLALGPEIWLAYSTETASLHQFWSGTLDFAGPAFDARHGFEPMSQGQAYLQPDQGTAWRRGDVELEVGWQAYGVDSETERAWLRYALVDPRGPSWGITESPELLSASGRVGLERIFDVTPIAGESAELELELAAAGRDLGGGPVARGSSEFEVEIEGEGELTAGRLRLRPGRTRLVQWFTAPSIEIQKESGLSEPDAIFADHDCGSCHHGRDRVVGPAWGEIAGRYAAANEKATMAQLVARIREGSVGEWGDVPMPAHLAISRSEAEGLVRFILDAEQIDRTSGIPTVEDRAAAGEIPVAVTFETGSEPPPAELHPSLRATSISAPGFTPQVGAMAWLPDGRLGVSTWDRDGAVFAIEGWSGPTSQMQVRRIAEGLHEPLGMAVIDDSIYVIQKQEVTQLIDRDGDDWVDEYRNVANAWPVTSNFHEFGFGLAVSDGALYGGLSVCVLRGGKSCQNQTASRGRLFRVDPETGEFRFLASGFRTPNGVAAGPEGEIYVTDNQGDWLPASKLMRVRTGDDFGWRKPGETPDPAKVTKPALWLPQNEVGNSPTQPLFLKQGPYAGSVLFGDIFNGGLKRGFLEEVDGQLQGAAFHFSGGLQAPVHRLIASEEGSLIAGEIGSRGNWGEFDKPWYGIERLDFEPERAFEPMRVEIREGGFEISLSRGLAEGTELFTDAVTLSDWYYVPTPEYGGPKYDLRNLKVKAVRISSDRRVISIDVADLKAGRVVYLKLPEGLRSERGEALWVREAWYTLNALPGASAASLTSSASVEPTEPAASITLAELSASEVRAASEGPPVSGGPPNTLTAAEREEGWRLLFDGESFEGWKIYGAPPRAAGEAPEGWVIEEGAFKFTRDVSLFGLVMNHLNPFTTAALDLMTEEQFSDFEFMIDWKISAGGNSGIFYFVREEEAAPLSWGFGLEMQVLDDAAHSDGEIEMHRAGDLYDLRARAVANTKPVGEWNTARIVSRGNQLEHWLNGEKLLEIERFSADWDRAIAASKFADTEGYGAARQGHFSLQDHGDPVWYRNIKVRPIQMPK
ncbi:MAG: family 16 glycoside hydrolase [Myxococcota bacterium]